MSLIFSTFCWNCVIPKNAKVPNDFKNRYYLFFFLKSCLLKVKFLSSLKTGSNQSQIELIDAMFTRSNKVLQTLNQYFLPQILVEKDVEQSNRLLFLTFFVTVDNRSISLVISKDFPWFELCCQERFTTFNSLHSTIDYQL